MAHDAMVASLNVQVKTIRAPGHDQMMTSMKLKADQGTLRAGLILAKDSSDEGVPFENLTEVLAAGDGTETDFSGTIAGAPLEPGTVAITDETETFTDDGFGNLIGSAGGTGTVIYKTGTASVSFNAAPANGQDITVDSSREIAGVLDRDVDTTKAVDGMAVIHGTVKSDELLKGTTPVSADAAEFKLLAKRGVWPV